MKLLTVFFAFLGISAIPAWITHLVVSIQAQEWVFMIVGALLAPVAVVHGWAIWLGYNWF